MQPWTRMEREETVSGNALRYSSQGGSDNRIFGLPPSGSWNLRNLKWFPRQQIVTASYFKLSHARDVSR